RGPSAATSAAPIASAVTTEGQRGWRGAGASRAARTRSANPAGGSGAGQARSFSSSRKASSSLMNRLQRRAQRRAGAREARLDRAQVDLEGAGDLLVLQLVDLA